MSVRRRSFAERDALEARIQEEGRELLKNVHGERLIALTPAWWQDRLMAWATSDPEFRVKLLRFVDVLPSLHSAGAIADHVRQYFRDDSPMFVRAGTVVGGAQPFRPILSKVVRQGVFAMADRFIGGSSPADALATLDALVSDGTGYTIDLLGEAVLSDSEADTYLERYLQLIRTLSTSPGAHSAEPLITSPNVSVKLSALSPHFEPAAPETTCQEVRGRLDRLLHAAREGGVFVNFDMEQYRYKSLTQYIFRAVAMDERFRDWDRLGIVVQAYQRDALNDVALLRALAEDRGTPVTVRLVKGAYWDEEIVLARQENRKPPVFEEKAATDECYEECTDALVDAYPHLRPAFGTHNPRSTVQAMVKWEQAAYPRADAEFQTLFGMAEGLRKAVGSAGYRTRVYVPVGEILPGMAYLVRRLLENTSNQSWLMNQHEEGDPEDLLREPHHSTRPVHGDSHGFQNAPPAEFYRDDVRSKMEDAIAKRRERFGETTELFIGGEEVRGSETDAVVSPAAPDVLIGMVARANTSDADRAVDAASAALAGWSARSASERAAILCHAADLLEERRFAFAATMVFESAKPWREADADVAEAIDYLRYYSHCARRLSDGYDLSIAGENNRYVYEPRGVAAIISPWNFPMAIVTGMTSAALAAGCTAVVKPAEQSPIVAGEMVRLLHEAGVPAGAINFVPGPGETIGARLVAHPDVSMIAFTGSKAVGLEIIAAAGQTHDGQRGVKHVVVEMGGKNAIIVDDDADLDEAVAGVIRSAFGFAGQKCSACSRVITVGNVHDAFTARLAAAVDSLSCGRPSDPYTFVPPVISEEAQQRIEEYIAAGQREGTVVARSRQTPPGYGVAPIVFEGIARDSALTLEEIFGPVLCLYHAETFEEAITLAHEPAFALTGGVYSRNPRHIREAQRNFQVGNLYINRAITGAIVGRQPFGGFGLSGLGDKAGGPDYLLQFMLPRVISENTMRRGFAAS